MKRSAVVILQEISSHATGKRYDERWQQFCEFADLRDRKPCEEDSITFFDHLKNVKNYAASTLWSVYSILNNKMQLLFGEETAANVMADGGASSSLMKKHFNWRSENTSQKYLENTDLSLIHI